MSSDSQPFSYQRDWVTCSGLPDASFWPQYVPDLCSADLMVRSLGGWLSTAFVGRAWTYARDRLRQILIERLAADSLSATGEGLASAWNAMMVELGYSEIIDREWTK